MPLDACESPTQACARSAQSDNLHGIDEATMQRIVKDPQGTVQTYFTGRSQFFSGLKLQGNVVPRPKPGHTRGANGSPDGVRRPAFIDRVGQAHVESGSTFGVLTQIPM